MAGFTHRFASFGERPFWLANQVSNADAKAMPMEMDIIGQDERLTRIVLRGRLELLDSSEAEHRFLDLVRSHPHPLLVDLSGVSFMASRGLRMLLEAARMQKARAKTMVLLRPQSLVEQTLRLVNLTDMIHIAFDETGALSALGLSRSDQV
jgi:anti-sigma B factor antagonist